MRIKADLYSGRLFEYGNLNLKKARSSDATGHQPSQYEDKHRDRSKHETQSYNDDERRKNIRVGTRPVPADGFYEWKKVVGGKIPYSIGMKDDSPFVLAGLWEGRRTLRPTNGGLLLASTVIVSLP